jgi:23S rRNA pseudouridine1911/1915/1917 synthase
VAAEGKLDIVYEDEDLAVVNKAPGVLVHPSHGHFDDTIGNFLMGHWRQADSAAGFHPVHRLDKGTSGLLVVAKHAHGQEQMKAQLHTGGFRRVYLAVCDGVPEPAVGVIDQPIGMADGSKGMRCVREDGKPARTRYRTLRSHGARSLVELELDTGRTHQIRVHMAFLGCPLTGDFLYGTEAPEVISRPALHSAHLELTHPITGEALTFDAPLPEDMKKIL